MKLVTKQVLSEDCLIIELPPEPYKSKLVQVLEKCNKKCNGYVSIDIERPYKSRTTGEGSQNNLFWILCTKIANEVGDDSRGMEDTENGIKMRALSRGYPYHISKITGEKIPSSMTTVNTVEMSYLIDTAYEICAELDISLEPQYVREEPKNEKIFIEKVIGHPVYFNDTPKSLIDELEGIF